MDVGYNSDAFRTPNLDKLAEQGMTFTSAYAPAANCAPSRACVHSGQWGPRHGVYTVGSSERGNRATRRLVPIPNRAILPLKVVTMAEVLQAGGYRTIHLGKFHIGKNPLKYGFDVNIGGDETGGPAGGYYSPWNKAEMAKWSANVEAGTHRIDVFVDEAVRFMEANGKAPMFIHFSPYLVHSPLTAVPKYVDHYKESGINPTYGSMVEKLDEAVGKLMQTLERLELADSTLVVFSSDNGGIAAIHSQHPLRGGKGSYYEGGLREPLVMRWPKRIKAGASCDEVVNTLDLFPTFLDVAQLEKPTGKQLDGVSLTPLMFGSGEWAPTPQFWHFPVYLQAYNGMKDDARDPLFRTRPGSALRIGRWKLHEYFEDDALELYDLSSDPSERTNLAGAMPDKTTELHRLLVDWRERVDARVPTQRNTHFNRAVEQRLLRLAAGD